MKGRYPRRYGIYYSTGRSDGRRYASFSKVDESEIHENGSSGNASGRLIVLLLVWVLEAKRLGSRLSPVTRELEL